MTNEEIIFKAKEEFKLRGFSHHTQAEYLGVLQRFSLYYENRPIESMGEREIREYLLYLIDQEKSSGTVNINNSALRFIFGAILERNVNCRLIPRQHHYREFPDLMSKTDIIKFLSVIDNLRDRAMFETIYGSGLRISEIVKLRVQDIDSIGMRIYIQKEKLYQIPTYRMARKAVKSIIFRYIYGYYNTIRINSFNRQGLPPVACRQLAENKDLSA